MQGGSVGEEQTTHYRGGPQMGLRLVGVEQPEVVVGESEPSLMMFDLLSEAAQLSLVAGQTYRAPLGVMAIDMFSLGHPPHFVHRVEELLKKSTGRLVAGDLLMTIRAGGKLAYAPPTITARGPEADDLPLEHNHPQRRVQAKQVVGRPQTRVATTDDRHIGLCVASQWRPRFERARIIVKPERSAAILIGHLTILASANVGGYESNPTPKRSSRPSHKPRLPFRRSARPDGPLGELDAGPPKRFGWERERHLANHLQLRTLRGFSEHEV